MPENTRDTRIATVMEQLVAEGPQAMAQIVTVLITLAMRMERGQFLAAGHYERVPERRGYASGAKPEPIDTLAGTAEPGGARDRRDRRAEPFHSPKRWRKALERGLRSCRAVMLAVTEMALCVVSTREPVRVMVMSEASRVFRRQFSLGHAAKSRFSMAA